MGKNKIVHTGSNSKVTAQWDPPTVLIFCDLCIKEIDAGNRPGTHFNTRGWKNLIANFMEATRREYNKAQLKNKWDGLKKELKIWKQLIGKETGLGWNVKKQTVDATDEWWEKKIEANEDYEKFQKKGIHLELEDKLNRMFMGIVAIGEDVWTPSSGMLPYEHTIVVDGSDDSEEEKEQNRSLDDIKPNIDGVSTQATQPIQDKKKKRVAKDHNIHATRGKKVQRGKGEKVGGAAKLSQQIDRLCDVVESKSKVTSNKTDLPGCSIAEVIDVLDNIPEIEAGGDLYMFATQLFMLKEKREMFVALKKPHIKVSWLQLEHVKAVQI